MEQYVWIEGVIAWILFTGIEIIPGLKNGWNSMNTNVKFLLVLGTFVVIPIGSALLACGGIVFREAVCPADAQAWFDLVYAALALFAGSQITHKLFARNINNGG